MTKITSKNKCEKRRFDPSTTKNDGLRKEKIASSGLGASKFFEAAYANMLKNWDAMFSDAWDLCQYFPAAQAGHDIEDERDQVIQEEFSTILFAFQALSISKEIERLRRKEAL